MSDIYVVHGRITGIEAYGKGKKLSGELELSGWCGLNGCINSQDGERNTSGKFCLTEREPKVGFFGTKGGEGVRIVLSEYASDQNYLKRVTDLKGNLRFPASLVGVWKGEVYVIPPESQEANARYTDEDWKNPERLGHIIDILEEEIRRAKELAIPEIGRVQLAFDEKG